MSAPEPSDDEVAKLSARNEELSRELEQVRNELVRFREASSIGWIELDLERRILQVNRATSELLGYGPAELLGVPSTDLVVSEDAPTLDYDLSNLVHRGSGTIEGRRRFRKRDGSTVWADIHFGLIKEEDGRPLRFFGQLIDVSAQVEAQQAALVSEERYRLLAENASDAVFLSSAGRVTWVSPSITELLGWTPEELIGTDMSTKMHPDDLVKLIEVRATTPPGVQARFRSRALMKNGDYRWVETIGRFFEGLDGTRGAVTGLRDVDEQVKLINALARSNEDLRRFSYAASHDLQAPLRTVYGFFELLQNSLDPAQLTKEQQEMSDRIMAALAHMHELIRDLLRFSRVDADRREPVPVRVAAAAAEAVGLLATDIETHHAAIRIDAEIAVLADDRQLVTVFQNLLTNALTYAHPDRQPVIDITARPSTYDYVEILVSDNGIGIPAKYHSTIFELFKQLRAGRGTGIGLSLVKRIIDGFGGNISVSSDGESGSTFKILLPATHGDALNA